MAGQDAICLLVKPDMDLVHKNLILHKIKLGRHTCLVIIEAWIWLTVRRAIGHNFAIELVNVEFLHLLERRCWRDKFLQILPAVRAVF